MPPKSETAEKLGAHGEAISIMKEDIRDIKKDVSSLKWHIIVWTVAGTVTGIFAKSDEASNLLAKLFNLS